MNIPDDKVTSVSESVLMGDVGITSLIKLKDISKKQYHSYTISKDIFNRTNIRNYPGVKHSDTTFYGTIGYLSTGQPFEFTGQDRVDVKTGNIVFKGDKGFPKRQYYKVRTNNILEPFEVYTTKLVSDPNMDTGSINIESETQTICIPKNLDDYCIENNLTISVHINNKRVPNEHVYVFSNGSITDFFVEKFWIDFYCIFDENGHMSQDFTIDVDVYDHKDKVNTGSLNGYLNSLVDSDTYIQSVTFYVPNERVPRSVDGVSLSESTRLFCNGRCLNTVSVSVNSIENDPNHKNVVIVTDTKMDKVRPFTNAVKPYYYEYSCSQDVRYSYFIRGIKPDVDNDITTISHDGLKYSVYVKSMHDYMPNFYMISLFVNDSKQETKDYHHDIINGSIPEGALSVYFNGWKIPVSMITQTSRFSYLVPYIDEYDLFSENNTTELSFFIEDTDEFYNEKEIETPQYGQDYYLANFLGTVRAHQYAYNNTMSLSDPKNYGGFLNRAIELEAINVPEDDRRINGPNGVNYNYFKNILGSRDNISTLNSQTNLFNLDENLQLYYFVHDKGSNGHTSEVMTSKNFSLVRELLGNFSNETFWDYLLATEFVGDTYRKNINITDYKKPHIKVFVNRKLIPYTEYTLEPDGLNKNVLLSVPVSKFVVANKEEKPNFFYINTIEIQISESNVDKIRVMRLYKDDLSPVDSAISVNEDTGELSISKEYFENFFSEEKEYSDTAQFVFMKRVGLDGDYIYGDVSEVENAHGWVVLKKESGTLPSFIVTSSAYTVSGFLQTVGSKENLKDIYLIDTRFFYERAFTVTPGDVFNVFESTVISVYESNIDETNIKYNGENYSDLIGIPIVSRTQPELYVNGELWFENVDYEYSTPIENDILACSLITLKKSVPDNSVFYMVFTEVAQTDIVYNDDCFITNKHGLLYFETLKYPFSLNYMDLYVNGMKVQPCDITILSDKMIRIGNVGNNSKDETEYGPIVWRSGFNSVKLRSRFLYSEEEILSLSKNFNVSDMEYMLGLLFHNLNPALSGEDPNYPLQDEIDEGYKTFVPKVDDFGGVELGEENEPLPKRNALATAYLEWLIKSKRTRSHALFDKDMDMSKIIIREFVREYFRIYDDLPDTNYDIVINSGINELIGSDILMNLYAGINAPQEEIDKLHLYPAFYKPTTMRVVARHFNEIRKKILEEGTDIKSYIENVLGTGGDFNPFRFMTGVLTDYSTSNESNIMYFEDYPINKSVVNKEGIIEISPEDDDVDDPENFYSIDKDYKPTINTEHLNIQIPNNLY